MKRFFINSFYFLFIILLTISVSTFALVRKVTGYQSIKQPILVEVDKEEVVVMNQAIGKLQSVFVKEGQYVKADEVLAKIDDEQILSKIDALEEQRNNLSAETEAEVLRSQLASYELRAPRDGIIYKVHSAKGSYLGGLTPVVTMYANDDTKLIAYVTEEQYGELKSEETVSVLSQRFEQTYPVKVRGVGKVQTMPGTNERKYELNLEFENTDEGIAFLEGETLELVDRKEDAIAQKPSEVLSDWVKSFFPQITNS